MGKLVGLFAAWALLAALIAPGLLLAAGEPPEGTPESAAPEAAPPPDPARQAPEAGAEPAPPVPAPAPEPAPAPAPAPAEPAPPPPSAPAAEAPGDGAAPAAAAERDEPPEPRARAAADRTVSIRDFDFGPASVTVNVGDTVTWVNRGPSEHTATGSGFDTGLLDSGESGSHTFDGAGTFSYICTPHPFMEGTVRVVEAGGGGEDGGDEGGGPGQTAPEAPPAATGEGDLTAGGEQLASTGADSTALAVLGALLLAAGLALRRRAGLGA